MEAGNKRQSNIELLRIIAISFVVILHYNNEQMGGAFVYAEGINKTILTVLECMSVCAVDVFVICSGYFLSGTQKRNIAKPLFLLIQVIVMQQLCYFAGVWLNGVPLKYSTVAANFLPQNWFVTLYIVLYFISPYINIIINSLSQKKIKYFLALTAILFSIYPTCLYAFECISGKDFSGMNTIESVIAPNGYSIVNFVLLYIIAACLRMVYINKTSKLLCVGVYLANAAVIFGLSVFLPQIAYQYYSPFVILCAAALFMLFREFKFSSRAVNYISKSTFTVFLLHYCILQNLQIEKFVCENAGIMLGHLLVSIIIVWLISIVVNVVYSFLVGLVQKRLSDNIITRKYEV